MLPDGLEHLDQGIDYQIARAGPSHFVGIPAIRMLWHGYPNRLRPLLVCLEKEDRSTVSVLSQLWFKPFVGPMSTMLRGDLCLHRKQSLNTVQGQERKLIIGQRLWSAGGVTLHIDM